MLGRIDREIKAGALNSSTGVIAMSVGMKTYGPYGFTKDGVNFLADVERWNAANQRDAASRIGAEFIDVKSASAAHSSHTTPDAGRMVSGWLDLTTPDRTMFNYPSHKGNHLVADLVGASLR
jgi:hypothetical protein